MGDNPGGSVNLARVDRGEVPLQRPLHDHLDGHASSCRVRLQPRHERRVDFHLPRRPAPHTTPGAKTPERAPCHDGSVPNQPRTPNRTFRIPDDIYFPAKAKAGLEGRTLTDVVRDALLDYIDDDGYPIDADS